MFITIGTILEIPRHSREGIQMDEGRRSSISEMRHAGLRKLKFYRLFLAAHYGKPQRHGFTKFVAI